MQLSSVTVAILLESGRLPIPVHDDAVPWSGVELKSEGATPLISDEARIHYGNQDHAFLVANETMAAYQKQTMDVVEIMDLDCPCSANIYEPERKMHQNSPKAPPRRFFRTFWRSVTLRALERDFNASIMYE